jgi:hypothetical protein
MWRSRLSGFSVHRISRKTECTMVLEVGGYAAVLVRRSGRFQVFGRSLNPLVLTSSERHQPVGLEENLIRGIPETKQ